MPKCVIGCKIPNGVILRNYKMVDSTENTPMGSRPIKRAQQIGGAVTINGPSAPYGHMREDPLRFGYALTYNVDREFMEKWFQDNWDQDMVANKLIIMANRDEDIIKQAKTNYHEGIRSGLEPLDPQNLPAEFRGQRMKIVTADEQRVKPEDRPERPERGASRPRPSSNGRARRARSPDYGDE